MKKFLTIFLTFVVAAAFSAALYDTPYIGNSNTMKFHRADCRSVGEMWAEHQVPLRTREEATNKHFVPCRRCRPDIN